MFKNKFIEMVINYCGSVDQCRSPISVLNALNEAVFQTGAVSVLLAVRMPLKVADWDALVLGKSVFVLEKNDFWTEYTSLAPQLGDPTAMMAHLSIAPYTWTESMRALELVAADRWVYELGLKHGIRDGFNCPVGTRWVVVYWSSKVLTKILSREARALLFLAASFAAIQLDRLVSPDALRIGKASPPSPRELAVLRLLSIGGRTHDVAEHLGVSEETVRTHIKRAQAKLGVTNRSHAVAEAMRRRFIA
jgi:DNA-binding CsgD family transcriptional regulator